MARPAVAVLLGLLLVLPGAAWAQSRDPVAAEALFVAGRSAFEQGDYETACAKFAESNRLDPAAGTLINLASCEEKRGMLASAWQSFREARSLLLADDERVPALERRMSELEGKLPRLTIELAASAPHGTEVRRDEIALGSASFGVALPVDPGLHRVTVSAPGHETKTYEIAAQQGQATSLVVEPGPASPTAAEKRAPAPLQPQTSAPAQPAAAPSSGSTQRTIGWVVGGVGLVGLAVGGVTGLLALDRKNTIEERCDKLGDRYQCDAEGLDAAESGKTLSTVSTIATPLGVAALATGVILILSAGGEEKPVALALKPVAGGALLGGQARW